MHTPPSALLFMLTYAVSLKVGPVRRVAVVGAGAGGLTTADVLRNNGFEVIIFEKEMNVGGVWKYKESITGTPSTPMYKSLRTNLPKQIMAFGDTDPFPDAAPSFLSHQDVQSYLENFAVTRALMPLIRFGSTVKSISYINTDVIVNGCAELTSTSTIMNDKPWRVLTSTSSRSASSSSSLSTVSSATSSENGVGQEATSTDIESETVEEFFDAVIICNGHYNTPLIPTTHTSKESQEGDKPDQFQGESLHSVDYDTPDRYKGMTVLVVGSKSSGTDLAREISTVADTVYVSDRSLSPENCAVKNNIHLKPSIATLNPAEIDSTSIENNPSSSAKGLVQFSDGSVVRVNAILWCTGYAYDYPFLQSINLDKVKNSPSDDGVWPLVEVVNKRKVCNLYQQVFSISNPTLSFIGLPYSVVPFPLFRLQAEWISAVYSGEKMLPSRMEQADWLKGYENDILTKCNGNNVLANEHFHYLGDAQWDYQRFLSHSAGRDTEKQQKYIDVTEQIYNDNSARRPPYPGAPDKYRDGEYSLDTASLSWAKVK